MYYTFCQCVLHTRGVYDTVSECSCFTMMRHSFCVVHFSAVCVLCGLLQCSVCSTAVQCVFCVVHFSAVCVLWSVGCDDDADEVLLDTVHVHSWSSRHRRSVFLALIYPLVLLVVL